MNDKQYWSRRHASVRDLRVVGHISRSVHQNERDYSELTRKFGQFISTDLKPIKRSSVLELGYGLGHYARVCKEQGFQKYIGLDFAAPTGPNLGESYVYKRQDIGEPFDLGEKFDLVTAIDVLFHLTDETRFKIAIENIRKHASGYIYFTGLMRECRIAPHVIHRGLDRYASFGKLLSISPWRDTLIARFKCDSSSSR